MWTLVAVYIVCVVLLHVPTVQQFVGSQVAKALGEKLGTEVSIGRVDLGLFNRIIIDDILIKDQKQKNMLTSHRLSAKISILDLVDGKISISSAQIFSLTANIYKPSAEGPLNCQFMIDSLQSKDTTKHTPLNLHISSLVIRNTDICYNRLDMPFKHNTFDVNHLDLKKLSAHILLNKLTDDSLSVILKKFSIEEHNSGLNIQCLAFEAIADRTHANISNFNLTTDNSTISLNASADINNKKITAYKAVISNSKLSTHDIALFVPQIAKIDKTITINTSLTGTATSINIRNTSLATNDNSLLINGSGNISSFHNMTWNANIPTLYVDANLINDVLTAFNQQDKQDIITKLGYVNAKITASGSGQNYRGTADLKSDLGNINAKGSFINKHLIADVNTTSLKLGTLINNTSLSDLDAILHIKTDIVGGNQILANTNANIKTPLFSIGNNTFRNLDISVNQQGNGAKASLAIADLNVNADINLETPNFPAVISAITKKGANNAPVSLKADIAHINPNALGLINKWSSRSFSASINAKVNDILHPLNAFNVNVDNFVMNDPAGNYHINNISASSVSKANGSKTLSLNSDFANATLDGYFDINNLPQAFTSLIASRLPTLPGLSVSNNTHHNTDLNIDATITNTSVLQKIFGIDLSITEPITLNGYINSREGKSDITLQAPSLTYGTTTYLGTQVHIYSPDDVLHIIANTSRDDNDGTPFKLQVEGQAVDNQLNTVVSWDTGDGFLGNINASSSFIKNALGKTQATVNIQPSEILIGDTAWQVRPSVATYYANHLDVDNFSIEHGRQHIRIDGTATPNADDSLMVNLRDVNVGYILDLVNFHSVEFDGLASGTAIARSVFTTPDAHADLTVHNFLFEQGRMGTLHAKARWDNELGQIDIDGICNDSPGRTKIDGYVSIKRNYIDLAIKADHTRLEFLQSFCSSFLENVQAEGCGNARVFGDLSTVNLTGKIIANGSIHVSSLGTNYTLHNDTVTFIPDEILFNRDSIFDGRGGYGLVSGALHHKHLTRMTFDFDINAHHLLCYDFPNLEGGTFCGHCVGTGNCKIKGLAGEITFDIDAYPEATSEIVYNVSSPDAIQNQEFITWRTTPTLSKGGDIQQNGFSDVTTASLLTTPLEGQREVEDDSFRSNIRLNFLIHCTPESTLRLIMDQRTGDYITLNGNGTLRATWYNKGGMQIFGNYNVDHGTYKMTMQQVITKNFEFQSGGSIVFGGDPFESTLNLQALYVVPSVSLSDLNLGSSLSTGTVRVNCLMNITGTAEHPVVDFDLSVPQASTDIQQMITSLMDSEQERTQQVIYLLSIGRFYATDNAAANAETSTQTSLAMQSFLSGTLSQQLNNIISNQLLKNNNWNFGANISPGDEGMNNAEYEGLINGRLFNNRLLINGQFGYRDNVNTANTSFIGDFDVRYLITPNGNIQVKVYNQATDRYFVKNNLNTQGIGIILKHDFDNLLPKFLRKKNKKAE